jgi:hypothetical protein
VLGWVLGIVGSIVLVGAWALSGPVGSSPDEPAHVQYAWGVVTGQVVPGSERLRTLDDGATKAEVTVPPALMQMENPSCYAFDTTATPTCGISELDPNLVDPSGDVHTWTYMTRYPPLYYGLVGSVLRVGDLLGVDGSTLLTLARIASGLLSVLVVAIAVRMLNRRFGAVPVAVAVAVAAVPAAWSHSAAINPNGFEIACGILLAATVASVRSDAARLGRVPAPTQIALVVAVAALAWARPLSVVWAGLLAAVLLIPVLPRSGDRRTPRVSGLSWPAVAAAALSVFGALAWLGLSTQTRTVESAAEDIPTGGERALLISNRFFDMVREGVSLLGWGDTMLPMSTFLLWLCVGVASIAALCAGSRERTTRPLLALAVAGASVLAVGAHSYVSVFGWQGRYILPVIAACVVLLVPAMHRGLLPRRSRTRVGLVVVVVSTGLMVVSLLWNLGRYAYGYRSFFSRFAAMPLPDGPATWEPVAGVGAVVCAALLGAALLASSAVLAIVRRPAPDAEDLGEEPAALLRTTPADVDPAPAVTSTDPSGPP